MSDEPEVTPADAETMVGTMLALVEKPLVPQVAFGPGGIQAIVEEVKRRAREQAKDMDISTPKERRAIRSLAFTVSKTKTGLLGMRKELTDRMKAQVDAVMADGHFVESELDALRDEINKPVDDWEARDDQRIADHESALRQLSACAVFLHDPTVEEIDARGAELKMIFGRQWEEFAKRAGRAAQDATDSLVKRRGEVIAEAEAVAEAARIAEELAEEERLRLEAKRIEREARIAREAAEAARKAAEAAAEETRRLAEEAAQRAAKKKDHAHLMIGFFQMCGTGFLHGVRRPYAVIRAELAQTIMPTLETVGDALPEVEAALSEALDRIHAGEEQEVEQAASAARQQEESRRAAEAEQAARDQAAQAERDRVAAEQRAAAAEQRRQEEEEARLQAQQEQQEASARAAEAESRRIIDQQQADQRVKDAAARGRAEAEAAARKASTEAAEREKDRTHRVKIHAKILAGLALANLTETQGMAVIEAIAAGQVPHVSIAY